LRERQNAPVGFISCCRAGTLFSSHGSPFVRRGFVVRTAPALARWRSPSLI
jgi:hypothetical protein